MKKENDRIESKQEFLLDKTEESVSCAQKSESSKEDAGAKNAQSDKGQKLLAGKFKASDVVRFASLIAFFLVAALVLYLVWPYARMVLEPGGVAELKEEITGAGPAGFLLLLLIQFLQIVIAFIPGEVVQLAAGVMYGPWLGTLLIMVGCVLSASLIYQLVHKLGAPFVQELVPMKWMEKFRKFEKSGKLSIVVFVLFLIPGMPKDVFTYLVPLTDMRLKTFLILSSFGRLPGVFVSCWGSSGIMEGDYVQAAIVLGIAAIIAIICIVKRDKLMDLVEKFTKNSYE